MCVDFVLEFGWLRVYGFFYFGYFVLYWWFVFGLSVWVVYFDVL